MNHKKCDICNSGELDAHGPIIQSGEREVVECSCLSCGSQFFFTIIDHEASL